MQQDRLAVQVLKLAVGPCGDRKDLLLGELEDDPQRRFRALHGRVGCPEANIHLAAECRLNGQYLVRERGPL